MRLASRIDKLQIKLKALSPVIDDSDLCWSGCGQCRGCRETEEIMLIHGASTGGRISWDDYEAMLEEKGLTRLTPNPKESIW